eukprot:6212146-Pleurochrysis_carterae.AAC.4
MLKSNTACLITVQRKASGQAKPRSCMRSWLLLRWRGLTGSSLWEGRQAQAGSVAGRHALSLRPTNTFATFCDPAVLHSKNLCQMGAAGRPQCLIPQNLRTSDGAIWALLGKQLAACNTCDTNHASRTHTLFQARMQGTRATRLSSSGRRHRAGWPVQATMTRKHSI